MVLEVAVFNISSAIMAEKAGADRIELCENPEEGGTTPSYGTLRMAVEKIGVPVFPMIRPRGGDFLYNEENFEVIKHDVILCKDLGFPGAVLGLLKKDGFIDKDRTKKLVELSYPLEITFHRAFDRSISPFRALDDLIDCGCTRILTSGQQPTALEGLALIKQLIQVSDNRITILPGCGVRSETLPKLIEIGAKEFHSSARILSPSTMEFTSFNMNENLQNLLADNEEIKRMKQILTQAKQGL